MTMRLRGRLEWLTGQFRWVMAVPADRSIFGVNRPQTVIYVYSSAPTVKACQQDLQEHPTWKLPSSSEE